MSTRTGRSYASAPPRRRARSADTNDLVELSAELQRKSPSSGAADSQNIDMSTGGKAVTPVEYEGSSSTGTTVTPENRVSASSPNSPPSSPHTSTLTTLPPMSAVESSEGSAGRSSPSYAQIAARGSATSSTGSPASKETGPEASDEIQLNEKNIHVPASRTAIDKDGFVLATRVSPPRILSPSHTPKPLVGGTETQFPSWFAEMETAQPRTSTPVHVNSEELSSEVEGAPTVNSSRAQDDEIHRRFMTSILHGLDEATADRIRERAETVRANRPPIPPMPTENKSQKVHLVHTEVDGNGRRRCLFVSEDGMHLPDGTPVPLPPGRNGASAETIRHFSQLEKEKWPERHSLFNDEGKWIGGQVIIDAREDIHNDIPSIRGENKLPGDEEFTHTMNEPSKGSETYVADEALAKRLQAEEDRLTAEVIQKHKFVTNKPSVREHSATPDPSMRPTTRSEPHIPTIEPVHESVPVLARKTDNSKLNTVTNSSVLPDVMELRHVTPGGQIIRDTLPTPGHEPAQQMPPHSYLAGAIAAPTADPSVDPDPGVYPASVHFNRK